MVSQCLERVGIDPRRENGADFTDCPKNSCAWHVPIVSSRPLITIQFYPLEHFFSRWFPETVYCITGLSLRETFSEMGSFPERFFSSPSVEQAKCLRCSEVRRNRKSSRNGLSIEGGLPSRTMQLFNSCTDRTYMRWSWTLHNEDKTDTVRCSNSTMQRLPLCNSNRLYAWL